MSPFWILSKRIERERTMADVFKTRVDTLYQDCLEHTVRREKAFVLFTSSFRGSETWCPDCERAYEPVAAAAAKSGWTMALCEVGTKEAWKDAAHPLRYGR